MTRLTTLVTAERARCLWYLRDDVDLRSTGTQRLVLESIQKHGRLSAFREAGELKRWLSLESSATS